MSIQKKQNLPESLDKLAAQRLLYRCAKKVHNLGFFLTILVGILVILASFVENITFSHIVTLVAIVTWSLDQIVLKSWESSRKKEAATIQEEFDCSVLDLSWPGHKGIERPTPDRIRQLAVIAKNVPEVSANLKDWYPPDVIPKDPVLAKIHCQRINCWWDVNLRSKWSTTLKVAFGILVGLVIFLAIITGITVAKLTTLTASFLRVLAWGVGEIKAQSADKERADRIHQYISKFCKKNMPSPSDIRSIQDEIFEHRRLNTSVPDWFYRRNRDRQESEAAEP